MAEETVAIELSGKERRLKNLEKGKATQFKPGQSGNPGGRPKKITNALDKIVNSKRLRRMADQLAKQAELGNVTAFQEIANRIEGKIPQPVTGADDGPLQIAVITHNIGAPRKVNE